MHIDKNGQQWTEMDKNIQKWTTNGQQKITIDKNRLEYTRI
jgi:peptidyl-tRNA hydrolase